MATRSGVAARPPTQGLLVTPGAPASVIAATAKGREAARFVSPAAVMRNSESLAWIRTLMTIVGASATGVLGLTGTAGFLAYAVLHVVVSLAVLAAMGFRPADYVAGSSPASFLLAGLSDNLVSFILFWTLGYGLVHIY
jgi:hypothetical protein